MKTTNILIPSDFTLSSLNIVPALAERFPEQKFNISFVHFLQLSDSISDLLLLSRRSREYKLISNEFYNECTILKSQFGDQIESITPDFFYGNTVAVFKNYLEAKDIELIALLQNHTYATLTTNSFDPTILMQRSGYRSVTLKPWVATQTKAIATEVDAEAELLQV
jgi:hypothetical protein